MSDLPVHSTATTTAPYVVMRYLDGNEQDLRSFARRSLDLARCSMARFDVYRMDDRKAIDERAMRSLAAYVAEIEAEVDRYPDRHPDEQDETECAEATHLIARLQALVARHRLQTLPVNALKGPK